MHRSVALLVAVAIASACHASSVTPSRTAIAADLPRHAACAAFPDCPETAWLEAVAHRAGYRVESAANGSLLVRRSDERIVLWTTMRGAPVNIPATQVAAVFRSTRVYGDATRTLFWLTKDGPIFVEPVGGKTLHIARLRSLVTASTGEASSHPVVSRRVG